jgi:hypothetical protein
MIVAIAPGIILPAETPLCFCDAIGCDACCDGPTAPQAQDDEPASCCCGATSERCEGPRWTERAPCRGCVVLSLEKREASKPKVLGADLPELALAPAPATHETECPRDRAFVLAPRATGHAPPGLARSLPLLI